MDVVTEVPESLKRLTRYIVRGFYHIEHSIIIDFLVRNPCMKEEDLLELLKFERKQLRAAIETLKSDQFIKVRLRVETDEDGKSTRHNYYFINYKAFVNVVKYKLDHMRRKIETEERDSTSRASFKCPSCQKLYTDLEADQLFDFLTQKFLCTYCSAEVEEQTQALPKKDALTMLAKFNEQIEPVYVLLREVEDIKLSAEILEPEPTNIKHLTRPRSERSGRDQVWSGAMKSVGFGATESTVSVEMEGDLVKPKEIIQKERPIWLLESTVEQSTVTVPEHKPVEAPRESRHPKKSEADDIMRTLLVHESKTNAAAGCQTTTGTAANKAADVSDQSDDDIYGATTVGSDGNKDDDVMMESEDDDACVPLVTFGHQKVPINEVTEVMVAKMTPAEKEEYIKLGQDMYADMYDD